MFARRVLEMASSFFTAINTARQLGFSQIVMVVVYRLLLRLGITKILMPGGEVLGGRLIQDDFVMPSTQKDLFFESQVVNEAMNLTQGRIRMFSDEFAKCGNPPKWHTDPISGYRFQGQEAHWTKVDVLNSENADIKGVWEASKFDWMIYGSLAYRITGEQKYLELLNTWSGSWVKNNPVGQGVNWLCGQEASYRMLQTLVAIDMLGQLFTPTQDLTHFVYAHCRRIRPTIYYAIAQDNNHGISEAAALYVGGLFLAVNGTNSEQKKAGDTWRKFGRNWLENRTKKLISSDGSFAEHSVTYHRIVLDILSATEIFRRKLGGKKLPAAVFSGARAMVSWLDLMTDDNGAAPLIGASDGTHLFKLCGPRYDDFSCSLQLGAALFMNKRIFPAGSSDELLKWFEIELVGEPSRPRKLKSQLLPDGGFAFLTDRTRHAKSWAVLRLPVYKFRPSQSDALHLDLWIDGRNICPDGGSYSYAAPLKLYQYFSGTASHNTVQIDHRDQMPRLGRFLFGNWLKTQTQEPTVFCADTKAIYSSYRDCRGATHKRSVSCEGEIWTIRDEVKGARSSAVLRWRLDPTLKWTYKDYVASSKKCRIKVASSKQVVRSEIVLGGISPFYLSNNPIPCLKLRWAKVMLSLKR